MIGVLVRQLGSGDRHIHCINGYPSPEAVGIFSNILPDSSFVF